MWGVVVGECLALISQSVAHPAAEAAFVTVTDLHCPCASRQQHHYSTLLMYTQPHTAKCRGEREQHFSRIYMYAKVPAQTHTHSFLHADSKTLKFIHKHRVSDSKTCLVCTLTPTKVLYCTLTFSVSVLPIFHSHVLSLKPK